MSYGYSTDLRRRALSLCESGKTQVEVCKLLNLSRKTLYNWLKLKRETGDISIRPHPSVRKSRKLTPEALKDYFSQHPDHFLWAAARHFKVHASAVGQACRKFGITRKKNNLIRGAIRGKKTSIHQGDNKVRS